MSIKDFFKKLLGWFKTAGKALNQVEDIMPEALAVAQLVAAATPNRTDDEILALAAQYAIGPVQLSDFFRPEDRLRAIARVILQRKVRQELKESVMNAALELAVVSAKP